MREEEKWECFEDASGTLFRSNRNLELMYYLSLYDKKNSELQLDKFFGSNAFGSIARP